MRHLDLTVVVVLGLVVYRLARAIAIDKIGEPLRRFLYKSGAKRKLGSWLFALVSCPWCNSVWIALAATVWWVWLIAPTWVGFGEFAVAWFAVAGFASLAVSADMTAHEYLDG